MAVLKLHRVLSQDGYGGGQSLKCMFGQMAALFVHQYEVNQVIIEPHQHTWGVDHMIGVECINMHWKRTASCTVASSYAGCSVKCNWGQTRLDGVGSSAITDTDNIKDRCPSRIWLKCSAAPCKEFEIFD